MFVLLLIIIKKNILKEKLCRSSCLQRVRRKSGMNVIHSLTLCRLSTASTKDHFSSITVCFNFLQEHSTVGFTDSPATETRGKTSQFYCYKYNFLSIRCWKCWQSSKIYIFLFSFFQCFDEAIRLYPDFTQRLGENNLITRRKNSTWII